MSGTILPGNFSDLERDLDVALSRIEQVEIPIHDEFKAQLPGTEFGELSRFDFYDAARSEDVGIIIATGEQRLYGNLLLTVGVRQPGE